MRKTSSPRGFALTVSLILMALIVIVIVAYLANTRTDRSNSSVYTSRVRARMVAEGGLSAAIKLLSDNTRYGNYITAMPAPVPSPAPLYTEVYRPTDSSDTAIAKADDFLQLTNAAGEILVSRAAPTPAGSPPQADPRPIPSMIPSAGPFALTNPNLNGNDSYDFNQIVRVGTNAAGRLVYPSPTPAYGQWVRLRNSNNELVGRYAFFIEDESMKVNVNQAGNNLASPSPTASPNLRINDLVLPVPGNAPSTQVQETNPSAILAVSDPDRATAVDNLAKVSAPGSRIASRSTLALLDKWSTSFSEVAHLVTTVSSDDDTTAQGWQRLDLNALVAATTDNASKIALAQEISDWIRDAWTGPAIGTLQDYQLFNDPRLRLQLAANIIDYIDADNTPTDLGNYPSIGVFPVNPSEYPVIGIEKIPYLVAVEIIYQASNSNGTSSATLKIKIQFRFINLYESDLDLASSVARIEVKGVPILTRNGGTVFDVSNTNYVIPIASLTAVNGTGTTVSAGTDGTSDSGARTFQTDWLENRTVTFNGSGTVKPVLLAGAITVKIFGPDDARIDDTAIVTNAISTGYNAGGSGSTGDFLKESIPATGPLQTASINLVNMFPPGGSAPLTTGDPRVRSTILNSRWYNISRSDASTPPTTNRIAAFIDKAEIGIRTFAFDWYDYVGNRPLAFHRNGPLRSIGELGNIASSEYPWRTIYLQYPERPANTTQVGPVTEIPQRRSTSVDYVLLDLFRTQSVEPRPGATNINTQQRRGTQQHPLAPLFFGELIGNQPILTQAMLDRLCDSSGSASISPIFSRRLAAGPPLDNTPVRPFFQIGELASVLSRMVNTSPGGSGTTGSPARSTVTYSALRNSPTTQSEVNLNYRTDDLAEQEFREVSNSITTRGNVFRILYVGQAVKDLNPDGNVATNEVQSEYLGEALVERVSTFVPAGGNPNAMKVGSSSYKVLASRCVTQ